MEELEPTVTTWYVSKNPGEVQYSGRNGVTSYVYAFFFVVKAFFRMLTLVRRGYRFDVASVHFATEAFLMRILRRIIRLPFVFVFEGYSDTEARQAKHANVQIAISNHVARQCFSRFQYTPKVIPIGVDVGRFGRPNIESRRSNARILLRLPTESKIVLTVGRLVPHKGIRTLIEAATVMSVSSPRLFFVVVGDGPDRDLLAQLVASRHLDNFRLLGSVSEGLLPWYYWSSDLFVLPETNEGFSGGLVILEAMSAGLPLVTTTVGGIPETVGDAAVLIPPKDVRSLANAIARVLQDDRLRNDLIAEGLSIAQQRSWQILIRDYEATYLSASNAAR